MKKWFPGIACFLIILFCGCGADPDLILQNGNSVQEETVSGSSREAQENSAEQETSESENGEAVLKESGQETAGEDQGGTVICAYICGAVCAPGVYELEADSRVFQLVELAGGLTEDADEKSVNLAEAVTDGQMIWIPTLEESRSGQTASAAGSTGSGQSGSGSGSETEKVNINTASAEELTALNGIGETKAEAIVAYREAHGSFRQIDDIMQVDGIGEGTFDKIRDNITV